MAPDHFSFIKILRDYCNNFPLRQLTLYFTGKVELPEWFYRLQIDSLHISGAMTREQEAAIKARFPHADVRRTGDPK